MIIFYLNFLRHFLELGCNFVLLIMFSLRSRSAAGSQPGRSSTESVGDTIRPSRRTNSRSISSNDSASLVSAAETENNNSDSVVTARSLRYARRSSLLSPVPETSNSASAGQPLVSDIQPQTEEIPSSKKRSTSRSNSRKPKKSAEEDSQKPKADSGRPAAGGSRKRQHTEPKPTVVSAGETAETSGTSVKRQRHSVGVSGVSASTSTGNKPSKNSNKTKTSAVSAAAPSSSSSSRVGSTESRASKKKSSANSSRTSSRTRNSVIAAAEASGVSIPPVASGTSSSSHQGPVKKRQRCSAPSAVSVPVEAANSVSGQGSSTVDTTARPTPSASGSGKNPSRRHSKSKEPQENKSSVDVARNSRHKRHQATATSGSPAANGHTTGSCASSKYV